MDNSEYQGYWWLPDEPEKTVPGILKFDPDEGATLSLLGSLKGLVPEVILGDSSEGTPITLKYCMQTKSKSTLGQGFAITSYGANGMFVGKHFQDPGDFEFERLNVEYLHLDVWADVSGFKAERPTDKRDTTIVKYERPYSHTAVVGDEYEVTLSFVPTHKRSRIPPTETITQRAILAIKFPEKKPLEHLESISYRLQHLLSVGTRRPVYPVAMRAETGPVGQAEQVIINYRSIARSASDKKTLRPHEMLFGLRDLPEGFGPAVERWLTRAEDLDTVYQLYLSTIYKPQAYIEQRFLNLVQALEVYHRRALYVPDLPKEKHERRVREILDAVPEEHRSWLERKLQVVSEPSLNQRLHEIFKRHPDTVESVIDKKKQVRAEFIEKVVATRNYLTHFDKSTETKAARGEKLHRVTEKLKRLIEICLLGGIGFKAERLRGLVKEEPKR